MASRQVMAAWELKEEARGWEQGEEGEGVSKVGREGGEGVRGEGEGGGEKEGRMGSEREKGEGVSGRRDGWMVQYHLQITGTTSK